MPLSRGGWEVLLCFFDMAPFYLLSGRGCLQKHSLPHFKEVWLVRGTVLDVPAACSGVFSAGSR